MYEVLGLPRRDVSPLGYVRWPRCLAEADMPAAWKAIHLKLLVFVAHKIDLNNPWGKHTVHWKEAREFVGGGSKLDIQSALDWLMLQRITSKTPIDMLHGGGGPESYTVLDRRGTGVFGQEMCWTLEREFVSDIADCHDGYGRVQLETVRRLKSFAALRLYLWAQMTMNARKNPMAEVWEPSRLAVFLRCNPEIRIEHLKRRVIEPAVAEITVGGMFGLIPKYTRETNTHGRAIKSIRFMIGTKGVSIKGKATMRAAA